MIESINLTRLRNTEHLQFMKGILSITQSPSLQCDAQASALSTLVSQIEDVLKNDPASSLTDELAVMDDVRDDLIVGLVKFCDAYSYHPDKHKRVAGIILSRSLESHGSNIASQSYSAESATITSVLDEWESKPALRAAASLIGTGVWTAALETANNNFKARYLQQAEGAPHVTHDTLKAKRHEANMAYHELRDRIDSFYTVNNLSGPWEDAIMQMNAVIHHFNEVMRSRDGNAANAGSVAMSNN